MIQKILSNLPETKSIVLTAQHLVNEQFRLTAASLGACNKPVKNHLKEKTKKFIDEVKKSRILSEQEKETFSDLDHHEVYNMAREIILKLTKREIKNPRT